MFSLVTAALVALPLALGLVFFATSRGQYAPELGTDELNVRRRVLGVYAACALVLGPMYSVFFALFGAWWSMGGPALFTVTATASYLLYRQGRYQWAAVLLALPIWFGPEWCVLTTGGLYSPLMIWMAPGPFMAGPLLGRRAAAYAGLASVLFCVIMGLVPSEYPGVLEMQDPIGKPLLFVLCGTTAIGLIAFYSWSTTGSYETARRAMAEKNEELADLTRNVERGAAAMQRILDNVVEGLIVVDRAGRVTGCWSAPIEAWFGAPPPESSLPVLVSGRDPGGAASLELGFEALVDGWMPDEVILPQMPARIRAGDRVLSLEIRPMEDGGFLLVMADVTEKLALAEAEAHQGQILAVFQHARRDPMGVTLFLRETEQTLGRLGEASVEEALRALHTVKGNAALFGLTRLAASVHELESSCADTGALDPGMVAEIRGIWASLAGELVPILGETPGGDVRISADVLESLALAVEGGQSPTGLARRIRELAWEPLSVPLNRLAEQGRRLAERLNKEVSVEVHHGGVQADPNITASLFAALVHLVRNAVDHGAEDRGERAGSGKPGVPRVILRAAREGEDLLLEVSDDGRGVAWERVAAVARSRGLPCSNREELVRALFADGVTTREAVSDVSGRGVGTASVWAEAHRLGGTVAVVSEPGAGATFLIRVPVYREQVALQAA